MAGCVCGDPNGREGECPVHWRSALIVNVPEGSTVGPLLSSATIADVASIAATAVPYEKRSTNPVAEGAEALAGKYRALSSSDWVAPVVSVDDFVALAELVAKMARAIR